jgi:hypothetical protein
VPTRDRAGRRAIGHAGPGNMTIDRVRTNLPDAQPQDLFRTVPVPAPARSQPVDIPGVLDQTRRLYRPYTGSETKEQK